MNDVEAVRHLLAETDPSIGPNHIPPITLAEDIVRARPKRNVRRRVSYVITGMAAAFLALVMIATNSWISGGVAYAATPRVLLHSTETNADAFQHLLALADIAAKDSSTPTGKYSYIKTQGWYLGSDISGERVQSAVFKSTTETWRAEDGSGRIVRKHQFEDPSNASLRERLKTRIAALRITNSSDNEDAGSIGVTTEPPSADPAELKRQLAVAHPMRLGTSELLVAVADMNRDYPLNGGQRAATLRMLANEPDVRYVGTVVDRAGRQGVGFAVDSDFSGLPTRHELIFDANDGRLLDEEQVWTTSAGLVRVKVPCVISYTLFENSGWVASNSQRPNQK